VNPNIGQIFASNVKAIRERDEEEKKFNEMSKDQKEKARKEQKMQNELKALLKPLQGPLKCFEEEGGIMKAKIQVLSPMF